jgi:hypothetical protein
VWKFELPNFIGNPIAKEDASNFVGQINFNMLMPNYFNMHDI